MGVSFVTSSVSTFSLGRTSRAEVTIPGGVSDGDLILLGISAVSNENPFNQWVIPCSKTSITGTITLGGLGAETDFRLLATAVSFKAPVSPAITIGNYGTIWRKFASPTDAGSTLTLDFRQAPIDQFGSPLLDCSSTEASEVASRVIVTLAVFSGLNTRSFYFYPYDGNYYAYAGAYQTPYLLGLGGGDLSGQDGLALSWLFMENQNSSFPFATPAGWTSIEQPTLGGTLPFGQGLWSQPLRS